MDEESRFNQVVEVLGNPVRRQIIHKLSEGPDYALRLSQELEIGQQLASKHLSILEKAGIVDVIWKKSRRGAMRKMFTLNKYYSLRIDFAPNLYNESLISFDNPIEWVEDSAELEALERKLRDVMEETPGTDQLNPLSLIVSEIDKELESLEKKRARLLYIRNLAMKETARSIDKMERRERQVVHHIIDKGHTSIEDLSRHLHLREEIIKNLLKKLKDKKLVGEKGKEISIKR